MSETSLGAPSRENLVTQRQARFITEFAALKDWEERYKRLIEHGKKLPKFADSLYDEKFKVRGCQSQVWLDAKAEAGKVRYFADSDSLITKGMIALFVHVLDGEKPDDIPTAPNQTYAEVGWSGMGDWLGNARKG